MISSLVSSHRAQTCSSVQGPGSLQGPAFQRQSPFGSWMSPEGRGVNFKVKVCVDGQRGSSRKRVPATEASFPAYLLPVLEVGDSHNCLSVSMDIGSSLASHSHIFTCPTFLAENHVVFAGSLCASFHIF